MKQDFLDYLDEYLAEIVLDHLNTWKDRYYRKKPEQIEFDLSYNYDWSSDVEWCENDLGRELDDEENDYFIQYFTKQIPEHFYL